MNYLGITFKTVDWLLANNDLLQSFKTELLRLQHERSLSTGVIASGPLRATSVDGNLLCVWNSDYLSGTDTEDWGFIKLNSEFGLFREQTIYGEVMERCLNLIDLRLQGFNLPDDRFIHRVAGENLHTCLAGRRELARHYSLGWYEDKVTTSKGNFHSLLIIGPSNEPSLKSLVQSLSYEKPILPKLLESANDLLIKSRQRPLLDSRYFEEFRKKNRTTVETYDLPVGDKDLDKTKIQEYQKYATAFWNFDAWLKTDSSLTPLQRDILQSDIILKQPLRIIGAAGTGKTLLMQLLAMKRLVEAQKSHTPISILYIVHNSEMATSIRERFVTLGASDYLSQNSEQKLFVRTLFEYAIGELGLDDRMIMDKDASQTKMFQRLTVSESIDEVLSENQALIKKSDLIKKVYENYELRDVFADMVVSEIGIGIKGRDLVNNKRTYVESERPFTRLHGILDESEREFVYNIFLKYNDKVTNNSGLLDSDDIAISFLGTLKTPLWALRRKKEAFDFVFIDETQLFNQNERQIFRFLTKKSDAYLPIVIALDEAQEIRGSFNAGFGLLGIEHLANETLPDVLRSTEEILRLAFYVIQRTTDLFGSEFPDFTSSTTVFKKSDKPNFKPKLIVKTDGSIGSTIKKQISALRKAGIRQIGIVIHPDRYFRDVISYLTNEKENITIATRRGEYIDPKKPIIFISKPEYVGGLEFDAVIVVGLEHGVTPPLIGGHAGLSEALEQQTLREMYLSFTRAKHILQIINSPNSTPSGVIQDAIEEGIVEIL